MNLTESKADASEINELKGLATKTDLRVLYTDIRSILVSYLTNLKAVLFIQHNTFAINQVKEDIESLKIEVNKKTEKYSFEDLADLTYKLRQELIDVNKQHKHIVAEFVEFSNSMQVDKTHFQLEVLGKQLAALDDKVNEEIGNRREVPEMLEGFNMAKLHTPRSSLRLTDLIDRNSSLGMRKPKNRFNTLIKNKKPS